MPVRKVKRASFLTPEEILKLAEGYYPRHPDLMTDLSIDAVWEYHVRCPTLEDNDKILFYLRKVGENRLELGVGPAPATPDLILYFTEEAIVDLMSSSSNAETYYANYSKIMKEGSGTRDLDYKMNKSTSNMTKLGYMNWAKRYRFMDQVGT